MSDTPMLQSWTPTWDNKVQDSTATQQPEPTPVASSEVSNPSDKEAYQKIQAKIDELSRQAQNIPNSGINAEDTERILEGLQNIHNEISELLTKKDLKPDQADTLNKKVNLEDDKVYDSEIQNINKEVSNDQVSGSIDQQEHSDLSKDLDVLQESLSSNEILSEEQKYGFENQLTNLEQEVKAITLSDQANNEIQQSIAPADVPATSQENTNTSEPSSEPSDQQTDAAPTPDTSSGQYTVQPGDSMLGIAEANGMSLQQIEELNPQISNPRLIFPGEQINIVSAHA